MGFIDTIKKFWAGEKESVVAEKARGTNQTNILGLTAFGQQGDEAMMNLSDQLSIETNLIRRYVDYENMDDYPEISSILDIYADDATIPDSVRGLTIWGKSEDKIVRDLIDDLLHRRLKIEDDVWPAVRTICKYGNNFAEIIANEIGVVGLNWMPVATVRRIVNEKGALIGFVQDESGMFNFDLREIDDIEKVRNKTDYKHLVFFYPWEVVHWRMRSKRMRSQYGFSVLDSARWVWKRLVMMEDTALVYKLTRSPARNVFYVDTGDLPPREAAQVVQKVRRNYKKKSILDPNTGQLDFKYNPLGPMEDIWIATRGGKESTRVEVLAGPDYQNMDDIMYFQNKLFSAAKVPRQYLSLEGTTNRNALAQEDVRFARTELRVQREFRNGMKQPVRIHMAALDIDPDMLKWDLGMSVPSSIFELQQIEVMNAQAALAQAMSMYYPEEWVLKRVFHHTDDDATWLTKAKKQEIEGAQRQQAALSSELAGMYGPPPEETGGGEEGAMESIDDDKIRRLIRLTENNIQESRSVSERLDRISPKIDFMNRKARSE